jgi:hypothetical protein
MTMVSKRTIRAGAKAADKVLALRTVPSQRKGSILRNRFRGRERKADETAAHNRIRKRARLAICMVRRKAIIESGFLHEDF